MRAPAALEGRAAQARLAERVREVCIFFCGVDTASVGVRGLASRGEGGREK